MQGWSLELIPDRASGEPLFLAISRSIVAAIRAGRLKPGDALPGSRTLATTLGVHRNTVLSALGELENQGFIETSPAKGTFVRASLPDPSPRALGGLARTARSPSRMGFELRGASPSADAVRTHVLRGPAVPRGVLPLLGGMPDLRLLPTLAIARAHRRALVARGAEALSYGDPMGDPRLRTAIATMLGRMRAITPSEEGLVVTRGSQMALYLAALAILAPGDVVLVESLGYRPAWEALRLAGAKLVAIPVDREGLRADLIEEACARGEVRAVYTTPNHQYPTTVMLSAARRMTLLELARRHGFAILEDDYDHEFHYDGRPVLPLASADPSGSVVYVGTLSKILAPGLRLGFVVAPALLSLRIAALRTFIDRQGDLVMERALADLLEEGEIQRHVRKMRRVYHARRDALVEALRRHLGGVIVFRVPRGGLAIWGRVGSSIDTDAWAERAHAAGVLVQTGKRFAFDGRSRAALRLGFAPLDEGEIDLAVRRLAGALGKTALPAKRSKKAKGTSPR
jgi:GntR family transcriptional regulator/MocR family aminotransferase